MTNVVDRLQKRCARRDVESERALKEVDGGVSGDGSTRRGSTG